MKAAQEQLDKELERFSALGMHLSVENIRKAVDALTRDAYRRGREAGYKEHQSHVRGQDMGG